jgi:hypothetical protein
MANRGVPFRHRELWEAVMGLAIRIALQVYVEQGKVDAYLYRRLSDGTHEAMEFPSNRRIVDKLMEGAGHFLNRITIREDERIGDSSEFEQEDDGPVPDVAFVMDVSREEGGIGITTQIFTLRTDGKLHIKETEEFPDKLPVVAQMSSFATELFRSVEEATQTKAKWTISKTFRSTNGGGRGD